MIFLQREILLDQILKKEMLKSFVEEIFCVSGKSRNTIGLQLMDRLCLPWFQSITDNQQTTIN